MAQDSSRVNLKVTLSGLIFCKATRIDAAGCLPATVASMQIRINLNLLDCILIPFSFTAKSFASPNQNRWIIDIFDVLHHVHYLLAVVQPKVVVGDGHPLKRDLLCIFEEGIRSPDFVEPFHRKQSILRGHICGQLQTVVVPRLSKEYVRRIRLEKASMQYS